MVRIPRYWLPNFAMLNYGIIEWDACVTILMFLVAATAMLAASVQSHQLRKLLQELLPEILSKGLTTMLLPCTIVQGIFIIGHHPHIVNWHS